MRTIKRKRSAARSGPLAGSLGPGRIAVLQPSCTATQEVAILALGTQWWWAQSLTRAGREALDVIPVFRDASGRRALGSEASATYLPELARWEAVRRSHDARFGLSSRFDQRDAAYLDIGASLFEARGGELVSLGEWTRGSTAPAFAETVFELLADIARRVGVRAPKTWKEAFGTGNAEAAARFLSALGAYSLVDLGIHLEPAVSLDALVEVLALAPSMEPAIEHLPRHFAAARDKGRVSPFLVARAYRRAVDAVGGVPPAWRAVDARLRSGQLD